MTDYVRWESVYLRESGRAWAVGSKGNVAYSEDWGQTWVMQESGVGIEIELWEVYFVDDEVGWIVGGGLAQPGVILHTTSGGIVDNTSINDHLAGKPFIVQQNMPNPFRLKTQIRFELRESAIVRMNVYNALGQKIRSLIDQHLQPGPHRVEFNSFGLPGGIYYYSIEADGETQFRKMLLLDD
jgi:hypothetical protein